MTPTGPAVAWPPTAFSRREVQAGDERVDGKAGSVYSPDFFLWLVMGWRDPLLSGQLSPKRYTVPILAPPFHKPIQAWGVINSFPIFLVLGCFTIPWGFPKPCSYICKTLPNSGQITQFEYMFCFLQKRKNKMFWFGLVFYHLGEY